MGRCVSSSRHSGDRGRRQPPRPPHDYVHGRFPRQLTPRRPSRREATGVRLAITGKKRSGQTTLASALQEDGWVMMSFADPIKNLAVEMCDVALARLQRYHELVGQDGRNLRMSRAVIDENKDAFRPFLQWLGTEFGRDFLGNV